MSKYAEGLGEAGLCDEVVRWAREYKETLGVSHVELFVVNRRWGAQLRKFGRTIEEVLRRDGRFAMQMNARGGKNVAIADGTREEAQARRAALDAAWEE